MIHSNRNIEDENIEDRNIEDENIEDENIEDENIEDENIEDENIEDENIQDEDTDISFNYFQRRIRQRRNVFNNIERLLFPSQNWVYSSNIITTQENDF